MKICEQTNSHFDRHFHHHSHHHNPGHHYDLICVYNIFHQLTAKLKIGPRGLTAARPVEEEPRREEGELCKRRRMEELSVQLWRKRNLATLTNAQVFLFYVDNFLLVQLTARSRIGQTGPSAVNLVMVEPKLGQGESSKKRSLEELSVQF